MIDKPLPPRFERASSIDFAPLTCGQITMLQARDKTSELLSSLLFLILGFGFLSGCQSTDNTPEDRQTAEMAPIEVIKEPQ